MAKDATGSTEIKIISPIQATNRGPEVPYSRNFVQPVHLKQGSMDGACGVYSIMMALIICGVIRYEDARSFWKFKPKTPIGKLFAFFAEKGPLVANGASLDDVHKAIDEYFPKLLDFQGLRQDKELDMVGFIEEEIGKSHPVLLLTTFEGGGHWVVVVGCEYECRKRKKDLCSLLILDPGNDTSLMSSWNGLIETQEKKGEYPYRWWTPDGQDPINVQLEYSLAIWPLKV